MRSGRATARAQGARGRPRPVRSRYGWAVRRDGVQLAAAGTTYFWPARPGRFTVRAVDEQGRSVAQPLAVEVVSDGRLPQ